MSTDGAKLGLLLALADDELVIGHRHSEWTGWAPHIEEDLAFSSIAQDELAHARLLYRLAEPLTGRDENDLAFGRSSNEYRNAQLCERPNGEWGYSLARQYLYDIADAVRVESLASSSWTELADAMGVVRLEEKYHLDHARAWLHRLAEGPITGRQRYADGLSAALADALGVFEPLEREDELVAEGVMPRASHDLLNDWLATVGEELESVSLDFVLSHHGPGTGEMLPTASGEVAAREDAAVPGIVYRDGRWHHEGAFAPAGRRGIRSDDFVGLWEEMTMLHRAHPGARW